MSDDEFAINYWPAATPLKPRECKERRARKEGIVKHDESLVLSFSHQTHSTHSLSLPALHASPLKWAKKSRTPSPTIY
jgi:hypothetical protein